MPPSEPDRLTSVGTFDGSKRTFEMPREVQVITILNENSSLEDEGPGVSKQPQGAK